MGLGQSPTFVRRETHPFIKALVLDLYFSVQGSGLLFLPLFRVYITSMAYTIQPLKSFITTFVVSRLSILLKNLSDFKFIKVAIRTTICLSVSGTFGLLYQGIITRGPVHLLIFLFCSLRCLKELWPHFTFPFRNLLLKAGVEIRSTSWYFLSNFRYLENFENF